MEKKYFFGNEVSEYGIEHGRVDYRCLAKSFDAVLANELMSKTGCENWELENGSECYYEDSEGNIYYEWSDMDDKREEIQDEINSLYDTTNSIEDRMLDCEDEEENWNALNIELQVAEEKIAELEREIEILEEEHYEEVFQYYVIDDSGARILKDYTHETLWYNEELDLYLWGVSHWGTSWDYVLTEIAC